VTSTNVVAVDVGGTEIKSGLVGETGRLVRATRTPTDRSHGWQGVIERLTAIVRGLVDAAGGERRVGAVGVVVPGIVDEHAGLARWAANLGWRDVPLRERLRDAVGLPVVLGQDVRAGALAEARLGAARGSRRSLFVAIGTGIAAALVQDGVVHAGAHGAAGEIGHLVVDPGGAACACGRCGCLETVASAAGIARRYAARSATPTDRVGTADLCALLDAGEAAAVHVWDDAVGALAVALDAAVLLTDPEVVVVGGGLSQAGERLLAPLRRRLAEHAAVGEAPSIVAAQLGVWAGCHGAGLLGWAQVRGAPW